MPKRDRGTSPIPSEGSPERDRSPSPILSEQSLSIHLVLKDGNLDFCDPGSSTIEWLVPLILKSAVARQDSGEMTIDLRHFGAKKADWEQLVKLMNAFHNCALLRFSRWSLIREAAKNTAVVQSFQALFEQLEPIYTPLKLLLKATVEEIVPSYASKFITDDDHKFCLVPTKPILFPYLPNNAWVTMTVTTLRLDTEASSMTPEEKVADEALCRSACLSILRNLKIVDIEKNQAPRMVRGIDGLQIDGPLLLLPKRLLLRLFETVGVFLSFAHEGKQMNWTPAPGQDKAAPQIKVFSQAVGLSYAMTYRSFQDMRRAV
jgi:hypothetical protein